MTKFEEEAIKEAEKCGYVMAESKIVFMKMKKELHLLISMVHIQISIFRG